MCRDCEKLLAKSGPISLGLIRNFHSSVNKLGWSIATPVASQLLCRTAFERHCPSPSQDRKLEALGRNLRFNSLFLGIPSEFQRCAHHCAHDHDFCVPSMTAAGCQPPHKTDVALVVCPLPPIVKTSPRTLCIEERRFCRGGKQTLKYHWNGKWHTRRMYHVHPD